MQNISSYTHLITPDLAWTYKIIPCDLNGETITLLSEENKNQSSIKNELEIIIGYKILFVFKENNVITELLSTHYRRKNNYAQNETLSAFENDSKTIKKIVLDAKSLQSSDIHIESYSDKKRIRFRIDGKLVERYRLPNDQYLSIINKIKIQSQLDIAEKRLPQDGRMRITDNELIIDIRVSILPTLHGEKVVLRLLNNDAKHISLESIGFDEQQRQNILNTIKKPHGIILISGPTGSGKTTTLYATLKKLNNEQHNILTIEDPIEYTLDGVNQVQLKESIGLTFASTLRTFLRQDPDIIMLGEIRDSETAQMAIRAALTGHLVLSTIHTNSAWSTISRLIDMGIPSFLLSNTINLTAAQRLVRKLCNACKEKQTEISSEYLHIKEHFIDHSMHYLPVGCNECYHTGYSGRIAIFEIIPVDSEISVMIKDNILDISDALRKRKITTLKDHAIRLVFDGTTSIDEIYPILINN